jgi:hypothetical protein
VTKLFIIIWLVLIIASIIWYGFLVFFVGYRGFFDVKKMIKSIDDQNTEDQNKSTNNH